MENMMEVFISFGPTLLFLAILITGIVVGLNRGFRKSAILAIHAFVAFLICFIAFLVVVNSPKTDANMVSMINNILGEGYLQEQLDVSANCVTLREMLIEYIPKSLDYGSGMTLVMQENGAYLGALVNLIYHIIFALLFAILYLLIILVLYIIYVIFYPERRYRRKKIRKEAMLSSDGGYKKRPLLGAIIGGARGLVSGLVCMSFLGSLLFVVAGGLGNTKTEDYDFGDESMNMVHSAYQSIGSYGTSGIFKILNTIKDKDDVPYYLFAADLVFQGEYNDKENNVNANLALTHELKVYTEFSRKTYDLLIKHDTDGVIKNIVLNIKDEEMDMMTELGKIMTKPEFQQDFEAVIDEFDGGTYFIDLGLSFIDSIVKHFDELEFSSDMEPKTVELIKILFKPGYKSPYIPEDQNVQIPAYISARNVLTKEDAKSMVKTIISLLSVDSDNMDETQTVLTYGNTLIPTLTELSIFSDERKEEINPLLQRIYSYFVNCYLAEDEDTDLVKLSNVVTELKSSNQNNIDWVDEMKSLLEVINNVMILANNVYKPSEENSDNFVLDVMFDIFDKNNEKYQENIASYNKVKLELTNSSLLSMIMAESNGYKLIEESILDISEDAYLSPNLTYMNKLDSNGNVVEYGEIYNLLTALEKLMSNPNSEKVLNNLMNSDAADLVDMMDTFEDLINLLFEVDSSNTAVVDELLKSKIIESVLSSLIISNKTLDEDMNLELYIPDSILQEENNQKVNLIKKDQLKNVLKAIPELLDVIGPYLDEDNPAYNDISKLISSFTDKKNDGQTVIDSLIESEIIHGTLANTLHGVLSDMDDVISIPKVLEDTDGTANVEKWIEYKEVSNLIVAVSESEIDLEDTDDIASLVITFNDKIDENDPNSKTKLDVMYESLIMSSTLTNTLENIAEDNEELISIPNEVYDSNDIIKKQEISALVSAIDEMDLDLTNPEIEYLPLTTEFKDKAKASLIIRATITNNLSENDIVVPNSVKEPGYLEDEEYDKLFGILIEKKNVLFTEFHPDDENKVEINSINMDSLTIGLLPELMISDILHATIIDNVIKSDNLDGVVIPSIYRDVNLVSDYDDSLWIQTQEMPKLVDAMRILVNDDSKRIDELTSDDMLDDLDGLNDKRDPSNPESNTKLNECYKSIVMRATMTDNLDDTLTSDIVSSEVREHSTVKKYEEGYENKSEYYFYIESELASLINSVKELGLDLQQFTTSNVKSQILTLNDSSDIITGKSKLEVIYSSVITKHIIGSKLDEQLSDEDINEDVLNYSKEKHSADLTEFVYKYDEVENLINALKALGISDITDMPSDYSTIIGTLADDTKLGTLYASVIARDMISSKFAKFVGPEYVLEDHAKAKELDTNIDDTYSYYKKTELKNVATIIAGRELTTAFKVSDIDLGDEANTNAIMDSYILRATFSKNLAENEEIYVPTSVYDQDEIISVEELDALFKAINDGIKDENNNSLSLDGMTFDNVNPNNVKDATIVTNSTIMRANITKNISVKENGSVKEAYVDKADAVVDMDRRTNANIYVLSAEEIIDILDAVHILSADGSFTIQLSLTQVAELETSDLDTVISSSLMRILISDIIPESIINASYLNNYEVYDLSSTPGNVQNISSLSIDGIKATIELL